jgi:hypothetical protein
MQVSNAQVKYQNPPSSFDRRRYRHCPLLGAARLMGVSRSIGPLQQMYERRAQALQTISTINELVT